ncbi:hypothetical protein [Bowmanella dokdonensis]|uniref:Uncharacterized protein n=1 Tax=Bowmanella dokdonensis TaxID=751969 RepID=A0A939DP01_9ALTE|nr:hypothetical protein [Bowmanella dokdonensis]MBN7826293.1 hypothetical protein [Bowmanella dokdonensis]
MTKEQMIVALKDIETKYKRNQEVAEEVWPHGSPFLELARRQAAQVMEEEMNALMRNE